jgi:hypothetical protein
MTENDEDINTHSPTVHAELMNLVKGQGSDLGLWSIG